MNYRVLDEHYKEVLSADTVTTLRSILINLKNPKITTLTKKDWLQRYELYKHGYSNYADTDTREIGKPLILHIENVLKDMS